MSAACKAAPAQLGYNEIAALLPSRAPWIFIDKVLKWDETSITVQKAISGGEENMAAHFKEGPALMPGVLIVEMVNQAAILMGTLTGMFADGTPEKLKASSVLARMKATFHNPAEAGDTVLATVRLVKRLGMQTFFEGVVTSGDRQVATVEVIGAVVDLKQGEAASAFESATRASADTVGLAGAAVAALAK